jgi:hypothetical protein
MQSNAGISKNYNWVPDISVLKLQLLVPPAVLFLMYKKCSLPGFDKRRYSIHEMAAEFLKSLSTQ